MSDLLVHNVDELVIEGLKARARGAGRPLQAELKLILEQAAQPQHARPIRAEYRALAERVRAALGDRPQSDSTELLAEDQLR